jgi:hypothetical protein
MRKYTANLLVIVFLAQLIIIDNGHASNASYILDDDNEFIIENEAEFASCQGPNFEDDIQISTCETNSLNITNSEVDGTLDSTQNIFQSELSPSQQLCTDEDLSPNQTSNKNEIAQIKKDLQQQCKEQFKYHKRQFAKQMLKKGRIFKSLGVLLRRNKAFVKTSKDTKSINAQGDNLSEVQAEIQIEEQKILDQFRKDFPEEMKEADLVYADNGKLLKPKYSYSAAGRVSAPGNITIEKPGGSCTMKIDYDDSQPDLPPVDLMPPLDLLDSYPDDCAYMISDKFTEADAISLMGGGDRSNLCNKNLNECDQAKKDKEGKDTFDQMDKLSDSFFDAGMRKMKPNFKIKVTRNLYGDVTPDLALKRGQFVQKYVYKQLQDKFKDLDPNEIPDWAKSEDAFADVFIIESPGYDGLKTEGDYGANPLAKKSEFEAEKLNLRTTLTKELNEIIELEKKKNADIVSLNNEILNQQNILKKQKAELIKLKNKLNSKEFNVQTMNADIEAFNQLNNEYYEQKYIVAKLEQDKQTAQAMVEYYKDRKTKIDVNGTVDKLDEFYQNRPEDFTSNKDAYWKYKRGIAKETSSQCKEYDQGWDAKLFNKFKMAKVEGTFTPPDEVVDPDFPDMNPKIQYMIEKMIKTEGFTCDYSMKDIKRSRKKYKSGNRNWPRLFWNIPWVTIKFAIAPIWLGTLAVDGVRSLAKSVNPASCPNWDSKGSATKRYFKGGNIKKKGKKGHWETKHKKPIKYDGDYSIWPEAKDAFNN